MSSPSVLPAAIDWLVGNLPAPLQTVDPHVVVADNLPLKTPTSSLCAVGRAAPDHPGVIDATIEYRVLGQMRVDEDWHVPCFVQALGASQSAARAAAWGLYDAVLSFVRANPTLGGLVLAGRYARVTHVAYTQPQDAADLAGGQWPATVGFVIEIPNSYIPA